jgi:hypothetical protein
MQLFWLAKKYILSLKYPHEVFPKGYRFAYSGYGGFSSNEKLTEAGHDAVHLSEQGLIRMSDRLIMAKAKQESRIVLTFDLDFTDSG